MNLGRAISVMFLSAAVLIGGEVLAAEAQGLEVDTAVRPRLDLDPVVRGPKIPAPVAVDPLRPDSAIQGAGGVPGTVGGGSGGQLPGGIPMPPPKKICPHGQTCAE